MEYVEKNQEQIDAQIKVEELIGKIMQKVNNHGEDFSELSKELHMELTKTKDEKFIEFTLERLFTLYELQRKYNMWGWNVSLIEGVPTVVMESSQNVRYGKLCGYEVLFKSRSRKDCEAFANEWLAPVKEVVPWYKRLKILLRGQ